MKLFISNLILALILCQNAFSATLNDAHKEYLNNDYEEALKKAKTLQQNDEVLYFLGLVYTKMGNLPQAREYLIKLIKDYPRSRIHEQAVIKLADTYFLEDDLKKAKPLYEDIEKKQSSTNYLALVYLRLAQIAAKEGNWQEKDKYVNLLRQKYPDSNELMLIGSIEEYKDFFTIQVGAFGSKKNALALERDLDAKYGAYIIEDRNENTTLYKVRIGKFKNRKEAEKTWGRLIKQGYPARIFP